jgi:hypothetical protein
MKSRPRNQALWRRRIAAMKLEVIARAYAKWRDVTTVTEQFGPDV